MPDHMHGLFESLADDCNFKKFANMFKQRSAFQYRRDSREVLWQEGYFDRVIRREEATLDVVTYIIRNPVDAGLCGQPGEYPYLGSGLYSLSELCTAIGAQPSQRWRP